MNRTYITEARRTLSGPIVEGGPLRVRRASVMYVRFIYKRSLRAEMFTVMTMITCRLHCLTLTCSMTFTHGHGRRGRERQFPRVRFPLTQMVVPHLVHELQQRRGVSVGREGGW